VASARRYEGRIQGRKGGEQPAHPDPLEPVISVGWIKRRLDSSKVDNSFELTFPPAKKRAKQGAFRLAGQTGSCSHPCQSAHTGSAREPHQQCLCLIVCVVGSCDGPKTTGHRPVAKRTIACNPRPFLHRGSQPQINAQDGMADSQVRADEPDGNGFGRTIRPDSVIDRCDFEAARKRVMSKQQ
jgi:hypothetical protein